MGYTTSSTGGTTSTFDKDLAAQRRANGYAPVATGGQVINAPKPSPAPTPAQMVTQAKGMRAAGATNEQIRQNMSNQAKQVSTEQLKQMPAGNAAFIRNRR